MEGEGDEKGALKPFEVEDCIIMFTQYIQDQGIVNLNI